MYCIKTGSGNPDPVFMNNESMFTVDFFARAAIVARSHTNVLCKKFMEVGNTGETKLLTDFLEGCIAISDHPRGGGRFFPMNILQQSTVFLTEEQTS